MYVAEPHANPRIWLAGYSVWSELRVGNLERVSVPRQVYFRDQGHPVQLRVVLNFGVIHQGEVASLSAVDVVLRGQLNQLGAAFNLNSPALIVRQVQVKLVQIVLRGQVNDRLDLGGATIIIVWMSVPFVVFSVYAALTQVSDEVLEASALDGATGWQRFAYIIFPTIAPVIAVVAVLQIIWDLRVFTQIYYLQGAGGLASKTDLLGTYLYRLGISQANYGVASAVALFMLLLTLIITAWYVRSLLKESA